MASLNTLRTRGGVVVTVVIGIALLAFLIGDFAPQSCSDTNVGVIEGKKIKIIDYAQRVDRYTMIAERMSGRSSLSSEEQDQVREMAWQSFIHELSYQPGLEKLGLWASDTEQADMATGVYLSPVITGQFANPQTGEVDFEVLRLISSSDNPSDVTVWNYLKEQMNIQRTMEKYMTLITKGMTINDVEIDRAIRAGNMSVDARVAKLEYSQIADSLVTVTKGEVKAYYDAHRERFKQEPSREIEYVVFNVLPNENDYADAKKYMEEIADEFRQSEAPMQYAQLNSQIRPTARFMKESQMERAMAAAIWDKPEELYGPVMSSDLYTIARLDEVKMLPDSVGAKHILLSRENAAMADSLAGVIRGGGDFATLALEYSIDEAANEKGGDLGVFAPEQMVPEFSDRLMEARPGEVFTVNTQFGTHIVEMTYKSELVKKAKVAIIKYRVEPSSQTEQGIYADASNFLTEAAGSYDNFKKASTEAALSKRIATIANSDRNVRGLDNSRELVHWAFNTHKGDVSGIMEVNGDYVIASLTGIREYGYRSAEDAVNEIRPILANRKKADMLIAGVTGSSIEQIQPDTTKVYDATGVSFGSFMIQGIGMERRLVGAVSGAERTRVLSKPVQGDNGVYYFEATEIRDEGKVTADSERVRLEAAIEQGVPTGTARALTELGNVKDYRVKYY